MNQNYLPGDLPWRDRLYEYTRPLLRRIRPLRPSTQSGMGAIPQPDGAAFRVWAPNAHAVFVSGSFNNWSLNRTELAHEANGYWSADVAGAQSGDEYKFVLRNAAQMITRADPYATEIAPPFLNSVISADTEVETLETDNFRMPPLNELVIYELHVGTFAADGTDLPGTFQGVVDKLPYLQSLGINAIELMPVKEFPGDYSWGYNPAFPFAITQTYGGRSGLQKLIRAAHAHGIAVIVDVVYNHFGPQDLSLWQFDGWQQDGKGGIYFYNDWRAQTPWADTRPDYGRNEVRQYIRDNVIMWLEEFGVDGLRWDATSFIRNVHGHDGDPSSDIPEGWSLMQTINAEVNGRWPHKLNIAEDLQGNAWLTNDTAAGGAGFHSQWDSHFVHPIRNAIITPHDEDRDMLAVRDAITFRYSDDAFARVIYTESHDEVANGKARVPEEIAPETTATLFAKKRATLGAALVLTTPGVPMLFQGQEFLESGWFDDHVPLDWQKADKNSGLVQLYRDLIHLRRNVDNNTRGLTGAHVNVYHVDNEQKVIAYQRWFAGGVGDDVIVVANFSHKPLVDYAVSFPDEGVWHVRFNSDLNGYDDEFGNHVCADVEVVESAGGETAVMPYAANITLGAYSILIFSQG